MISSLLGILKHNVAIIDWLAYSTAKYFTSSKIIFQTLKEPSYNLGADHRICGFQRTTHHDRIQTNTAQYNTIECKIQKIGSCP